MPTFEQAREIILDHVGVVGAESVEVLDAVRPDAHVRREGEDLLSGETVLEAGTILGAAGISAPVSARAVAQVSQQVLAPAREGRGVKGCANTTSDGRVTPARTLRDAFGREFHYLRLSVTDRCNFRCVYCLPEGCHVPAAAQALSAEEIGRLVRAFTRLGFWKFRLTGGEPTVRRDICEVVRRVAAISGVRRVGLTTNGYRLASIAAELRDAGLSSLNVSLDSLDPERFRRITGTEQLERVVAGVEAALAAGIPSVKLNVVLMSGMEEAELERFLGWTEHVPLIVRFIELMETGENTLLFRRSRLPAEEVRQEILRRGWSKLPRDQGDGPATNYAHPAHAGKIGLISAYSAGFCNSCNRLRVSSNGDLKLCLFGDEAVPLRPLLARDDSRDALVGLIESSVRRKPEAHLLRQGRCGSTANLAATGG